MKNTKDIPAIIEDRLKGLYLRTGSHRVPGTPQNPNCELCGMEAGAFIYGFSHSDSEEHACPVIGSIVRPWNDWADDATRQKLVPLLARIGISRSTPAVEMKRRWHFLDCYIRTIIPGILDELGAGEAAVGLRGLEKVHDEITARRSRDGISSAITFLESSPAPSATSTSPSHFLKRRDLALRDLDLALRDLARALRDLALALDLALRNKLFYLPMLAAIETALDITE